MPRPHRVGHYALMSVVCLSVCLSVCPYVSGLTLSRERKAKEAEKLAGRKPMTRVTRDPIQMPKGQRSRSLGRLMTWRKIRHIVGTESPTNFKLGIRMEYDDPHHRHAQWPPNWKLWVAVQVTSCRGRGHIVSAPLQAMQWLCESGMALNPSKSVAILFGLNLCLISPP